MKHIITMAALLCGTAQAEFFTGNELLRRMNSEAAYERGTALGYVIGAHDATRSVVHCSPDAASAGQVRDMVRAHLESNPDVRHLAADQHVTYVLKKAWPCAANKGGGSAL